MHIQTTITIAPGCLHYKTLMKTS